MKYKIIIEHRPQYFLPYEAKFNNLSCVGRSPEEAEKELIEAIKRSRVDQQPTITKEIEI